MTSQTGGTVYAPGSTPDPAISYFNNGGDYGGHAGGGRAPSCTGEITTTFTWVGDNAEDEPPPVAIVGEWCKAAWGGIEFGGPPSGTADNGLGDPAVQTRFSVTPIPLYPGAYMYLYGVDYVSEGTHYRVIENPGESFQIHNTPRATATSSQGVGSYVWYRANAYGVKIHLEGGSGPSDNKRYLIGQKVTATMHVGDGNLIVKSRDWHAAGGSPFKNWVGVYEKTIPEYLALETDEQFVFYFQRPTLANETATVTCRARFGTPAGSLPLDGIDITVNAECRVQAPDRFALDVWTPMNAHLYPGGGDLIKLPGYPVNGVGFYYANDPSKRWLSFRGLYAPLYPWSVGIRWDGYVDTSTSEDNPWGGDGGWNFVQTVLGEFKRTINGYDEIVSGNTLSEMRSDTTYPYEPVVGYGTPGAWPANGWEFTAADSPGIEAESSYTKIYAHRIFDTWMMYRPPEDGSVFVPLKTFRWHWLGSAEKVDLDGWQQVDLGISSSGYSFGADYPELPMWLDYSTNRFYWDWISEPNPSQTPGNTATAP